MTPEIIDLMEADGQIRNYLYLMELKSHLPPDPVHLRMIRVYAGDIVAETSRQLKEIGKP